MRCISLPPVSKIPHTLHYVDSRAGARRTELLFRPQNIVSTTYITYNNMAVRAKDDTEIALAHIYYCNIIDFSLYRENTIAKLYKHANLTGEILL